MSPCTSSEEAARRSANSTRRPRLLLFYHVAKTGGTSVALALARRALAGRLDLFVPLQLARCWLYHAHGTLLEWHKATRCNTWTGSDCVSTQSCCAVPDWRTSTIAVEFHAYSAHVFLSRVMPSLKQLSYSYRRLGGTLLTATALCSPVLDVWLLSRLLGTPFRQLGTKLQHGQPYRSIQYASTFPVGLRAHA